MAFFLLLLLGVANAWAQPTPITSLSEITSNGDYIITADITVPSGYESLNSFSGTLEAAIDPATNMPYHIKNLGVPLFTTLTGTVRNLVLEDVSISGNTGNTGAIACTANEGARIYNVGILSGSVGGSGYTGGLVGLLDGTARVVNCYSFANITAGSEKAGIVGHNNYASKSGDIRTMVMNCMFYGEITCTDGSDNSVFPIYGGLKISNEDDSKLNNYNYFLYEAGFSSGKHIPPANYNCALAAEARYLVRWEFYRNLVNSTREVAAWYVTGNTADGKGDKTTNKMLKWVLDKSIAPYPIQKEQGIYPSPVNYDPEYTNDDTGAKVSRSSITERNQGKNLGTLNVSISMPASPTGGKGKPTDASLTKTSLTLQRTDKDYNNFNFNYDKVQLPYYNEVGTGNYTYERVVTGWMITSISSVVDDPYTSANYTGNKYDSPNYNFADRKSSKKDLYAVSGRVFSQGAYFDVPEGVTSITIEPYWACAAYCSDAYYDCWGKNNYEMGNGVTDFGVRFQNGGEYAINGNNQKVYITLTDAYVQLETLGMTTSTSIYDYAIVLVGNCHQKSSPQNTKKHFTVMSADLNFDNEPDYSLIITTGKQEKISPIRFDFINVPGVAMAHKKTSTTYMGILGNLKPAGWFETTNTATIRFSQFEYDSENKSLNEPLILMGGIVDMFTSTNGSAASTHTKYMIMGGNVYFQVFNIGCHMDKTYATPHRPISITGGDYDKFYLSGYLRPDASPYTTEDGGQNAECYIRGGRFGEVAGAGYEQISGNVTWQIYNADIDEFYGGGINHNKPVTGDISTTIYDSHVGRFCGGPKFGNMSSAKTVKTNAFGCTFDNFFGAGYGGTALTRVNVFNKYNTLTYDWNGSSENTKIVPQFTESNGKHHRGKYVADQGISINYDYRNFEGSNDKTVGYLFVNYASLSLAQTDTTTSVLKDCVINQNFYGGGSLGKVAGDATSTLTDCEVKGNVFGAGFSAQVPTAQVFPDGNEGLFKTPPVYNDKTGVFEEGVYPDAVTYLWSNDKGSNVNTLVDEDGNHYIHVDRDEIDLNELGTVSGKVTLNIEGTTTVAGSVYGGGEMSGVGGSVVVNMNSGQVSHDVYGGGALANTNTNNTADDTSVDTTTVNLHGGVIDGDVYGGGLGVIPLGDDPGVEAIVYGNVLVELNKESTDACVVKGAIYGCNNLHGTPKGNVKVHIHRTKGYAGHWRTGYDDTGNQQYANDSEELLAMFENPIDSLHSYELAAVYGGGNLAAYVPFKALGTDTEKEQAFAHVIIDGCGETSICQVYGGGNAASAPGTRVDINGTYEIQDVFGGGNGKDRISKDGGITYIDNPGANVGYYEYADDDPNAATHELREQNFAYGNGRANVLIHGGRIHRVYGGSNTKGNVREVALTLLEEATGCPFIVDEAYGGGKRAMMDGKSILEMACIPGLREAYGGAEAANIDNDVVLNITNGHFNRVFGGNNISGSISGTIEVNIEETGCHLLTIGQLYGGGNLAPYTAPADEHGPTLNVRSFSSIGDIFGGGYGKTAKVTGDTYVNINVCDGKDFGDADKLAEEETEVARHTGEQQYIFKRTDEATGEILTDTLRVYLPPFTHAKIGAVNNIYGGGNEAPVIGNTHVFIGNQEGESILFETPMDAPLTKTVRGADIRGNVFGGGNKAEVTGDTKVVIGKSTE